MIKIRIQLGLYHVLWIDVSPAGESLRPIRPAEFNSSQDVWKLYHLFNEYVILLFLSQSNRETLKVAYVFVGQRRETAFTSLSSDVQHNFKFIGSRAGPSVFNQAVDGCRSPGQALDCRDTPDDVQSIWPGLPAVSSKHRKKTGSQ